MKDNVLRVVSVNDVEEAEKAIKNAFKKKYRLYSKKSKERFLISDIEGSLKIFDATIERFKTKDVSNEHVKQYDLDSTYGTGILISPLAAILIISMFSDRDYNTATSLIRTVEAAYGRINKDDFIAITKIDSDTFQYWKYYGYVIIINLTKSTVNISRLWRSICKTEKISIRNIRITDFLDSAPIQRVIKRGKITIEDIGYRKEPLMNGKWAPIIFIHLILHYLNAEYLLDVSNMLIKMIFDRTIQIKTSSMSGGYRGVRDIMRRSYDCFLSIKEYTYSKKKFENHPITKLIKSIK